MKKNLFFQECNEKNTQQLLRCNDLIRLDFLTRTHYIDQVAAFCAKLASYEQYTISN